MRRRGTTSVRRRCARTFTVHIVVVGAGEVGSYVAERLSREGHDVYVVERDPTRLRAIADQADVMTVEGSGTHPVTLKNAGIERSDLIVAVTSSDEVNLIASMLAKQYGVERSIVRIEAPELRGRAAIALQKAAGADLVIDPDDETAHEIFELLEYPGATEIAVMANGEAIVIGARLSATAPLVGMTLAEIGEQHEPHWDFMVGSITRGDTTVIARKNQKLLAEDLVLVVCKRDCRRTVSELLGLSRATPHRVLLLGGGRTAEILAQRLAKGGIEVAIVESRPERAGKLAARLKDVVVINGDITDSDVLEEADISRSDVVVALTGEDDANILACLYAKSVFAKPSYARSGRAGQTIAVVHKLGLLSLLGGAGVDVALSPRTATANGVMRFVRGDVTAVATFLHSEAEVLEFEVMTDSRADGSKVRELGLPKDVLIGAIVRDGNPEIARGRSRLRGRDHIVAFSMPGSVGEVSRLFE